MLEDQQRAWELGRGLGRVVSEEDREGVVGQE